MYIATSKDRAEGAPPFPDLSAHVSIKLDTVKSVELLHDEEAAVAARAALNASVADTVTLHAPMTQAKRDLTVNTLQNGWAKHIFATITDQELANRLA
ncbi:hypothetical protein HWV62_165 [Athelia sp. TMB]|nr:hypothetical protein HWV62_165 [Athelia sp. TMB]